MGTYSTLKASAFLGSIGTQILPNEQTERLGLVKAMLGFSYLPVLGWTHQGDFNKWLMPVDTLASKRG